LNAFFPFLFIIIFCFIMIFKLTRGSWFDRNR